MEIGTVRLVNIEEEMRGAYLDYAMSVITARALPDVRDGLKPVQRRILYAMHELGLRPGSPYKKSARIVGETMGKYHPHGDSPIYEAMVRMAQDFSLRYMLVDGQGNFGSVDGDPPAAQRYTEARLAAIAEEMLADIEKDTVDFAPNFDATLKEPSVLPARLPNLLVNGASGIAVGMATSIPPHNLTEVADALTFAIDQFASAVDAGVPFEVVWARVLNSPVDAAQLVAAAEALPEPLRAEVYARAGERATPEARGQALLELVDERVDVTPDQLMAFIKGPDFPTGGVVVGVEGIRSAYATGRGRITIRAKAHTEDLRGARQALVITELPFQVNKASLIEKIADLIRERRVEGISDVRDESDREGMRVVVELKRDVQARQVLNALYKYTAMQTAFSTNMVALVDGQPRVLTLKMALLQYVSYRREVATRRAEHDLGRAKARAHILEGLKIALDNLDAVIATIRASRDAEAAREALIRKFKLTEIQAQAILDMQLRRLAALEREKILAELAEIRKLIAHLEDLLAHPIKILLVVRQELQDLRTRYGDARRTAITEKEVVEFTQEDLIPEQEVVVVVSARDYVKRMPADAYRSRGRGAAGQSVAAAREDDAVQHLLVARTHDTVLFFTNQGRVYASRAHELPEASRQARGTPLVNLLKLGESETVTAVVAVPGFEQAGYLVLVTRGGEVKRLAVGDLASVRSNGLNVVGLPEGDELGWARLTTGADGVVLVSAAGQAILFREDEVRSSGRGSGGVRAMRLDDGDRVAGADVVEPGGELVVVTRRGSGKRLPLDELPTRGRGGGGVRAITTTSKTGPVAAARAVAPGDEALIISAEGVVAQTPVSGIPRKSRTAQGAPVIDLNLGDAVVALARLRAAEAPTNGGADRARAAGRRPAGRAAVENEGPGGEAEPEAAEQLPLESGDAGLAPAAGLAARPRAAARAAPIAGKRAPSAGKTPAAAKPGAAKAPTRKAGATTGAKQPTRGAGAAKPAGRAKPSPDSARSDRQAGGGPGPAA